MPTLHSRRTSTWHALLRPSPRRKGNHSGRREWPRSSRLSRHRLPARTEPPLHLPLRPLLQPPLQPPSPLRVNIVDWNPDSPPTDLDITPQRVCLPALARMSTLESRRFHLMASPSCPSMRLFAQKAYLRVTPARQPSHLAPFVPELFPKDKKFRAAARHHRCPVCDLMKGARHYRKSRRMKTKAARDHARKHKQAARASILRPSAAPDPHAAARDGDRRNRFPVGSPHSSQIGSRIPLGILPSSVGSSIIGQRKATRPRG
mmetsp:Transcript_29764/g.61154  ORF Transcript_29764/g.61154 Transcript_29764/m.61154 type:complete len:261 (+) Transcript_29764:291-1073(+)